jgi:hypothetical protein
MLYEWMGMADQEMGGQLVAHSPYIHHPLPLEKTFTSVILSVIHLAQDIKVNLNSDNAINQK